MFIPGYVIGLASDLTFLILCGLLIASGIFILVLLFQLSYNGHIGRRRNPDPLAGNCSGHRGDR